MHVCLIDGSIAAVSLLHNLVSAHHSGYKCSYTVSSHWGTRNMLLARQLHAKNILAKQLLASEKPVQWILARLILATEVVPIVLQLINRYLIEINISKMATS